GSPPFLFTSSFQIWMAISAGLPFAERPPVSAMPSPILIGSAARATNTSAPASASVPATAPTSAQPKSVRNPFIDVLPPEILLSHQPSARIDQRGTSSPPTLIRSLAFHPSTSYSAMQLSANCFQRSYWPEASAPKRA